MAYSEHSRQDKSLQTDLLADFKIIEEIGRGDTSVVHSAICQRGRLRNRIIALKKINTSGNPNAAFRIAHLKMTSKLHQSLFHPSVVSLLSVFSNSEAQFHALEYCPNETLFHQVKMSPTSRLSEPELRGVVKALLDGLVYLRKELVIHRDLKPTNVLVSGDWRPKIADFSLAVRVDSEMSMLTESCGTPQYRSPQLAACEPYGFETDLWTLGALMVMCLTGSHPFNAPSKPEIDKKVSQADYTLPNWLSFVGKDFVSRLLKIDRDERISLYDALSHSFFGPTLPVTPLRGNIPQVTITQPTPSQQRVPRMPQIVKATDSRYPSHLFKAKNTTSEINEYSKDLEIVQERRNFLSDTWEPRQPSTVAASHRRITSVPADTSKLQNVTPLNLRSAVYQPRFSSFASNTNSDRLDAGRHPLDAKYCTPPLMDDSDDTGSSSSASTSRSDSGLDSELEPLSASDLRLDSGSLVLEWKARVCRKANPMLTIEMARQAVKDLECLSELAVGGRKERALVPASPVSSASSDAVPSGLMPLRNAEKNQGLKEYASSPGCLSGSSSVPGLDHGQVIKAPEHAASQSLCIRTTEVEVTLNDVPSPGLPDTRPLSTQRKSTQPSDVSPPDAPRIVSAEPVMSVLGKPTHLNTQYLTAQTQKLLKGQVTVLPSKSLLVDLREGERRKGRKGDEVLVISPDGEMIKTFSAPHLSTPCCLVEPSSEYSLGSLPRNYWGQYTYASKVVDQLKQRVPKFVFYKSTEAQCILMANEPCGDVEVIIPPLDRRQSRTEDHSGSSLATIPGTRLRLRLRQERRTLEILRYSHTAAHCNDVKSFPSDPTVKYASERSNSHSRSATSVIQKVLPLVRAGYQVEFVDEGMECMLDESEAVGVKILREFLAVCCAAESCGSESVQDRASASQGSVVSVVGNTTVHRKSEAVAQDAMDVGGAGACAVVATDSSLNAASRTAASSSSSEESVRVRVRLPPRPGRFRVPRSRASSSEIPAGDS